jgi:uncharacterized membrane protein YbaN (DUF454 family)
MLRQTWRWLMLACGALSLLLGIVGIFLPLLPTTPFVLLAAFFFSKGSQRLHRWLVEHPRFGRYLRDWEAEQVIPPAGKYASTLMMVPSVSLVIVTREIPWVLEVVMAVTVAFVLLFIWTRPSRRSPIFRAPKPAGVLSKGHAGAQEPDWVP